MNPSYDFTAYNNAAIIGPGVWLSLHLKASELRSSCDINSLFNDIDRIRRRFPCENCREHFNEFCQANDPEGPRRRDLTDLDRGVVPENLAKWLTDAHNSATRYKFSSGKVKGRFRPDLIPYAAVRDHFNPKNIAPCQGDCEGLENSPSSKPSVRPVEPKPVVRLSPRAARRSIAIAKPEVRAKVMPL